MLSWLYESVYGSSTLAAATRAEEKAARASAKPGLSPAAAAGSRTSPYPRAERPSVCAGYSFPRVAAGTAGAEHCWSPVDANAFSVRNGPDYPRNGLKAPSAPALGEVVAVDVLTTPTKVFDFLSLNHVELPPPTPGWAEPYPELFVINQMVPLHFHNSFRTDGADGPTCNLVLYVRLRPGLGAGWAADRDPCDAEQLLRRFVLRAAQDDGVAHCFKQIGILCNLEAMVAHLPRTLASLIRRFNGKPILTRPEQRFHTDPAGRYFAADLDAHCYKYMTRSAVAAGIKHVGAMVMRLGFVVEARKEAELPEVMLGCCELRHVQEARVPAFPPPPAEGGSAARSASAVQASGGTRGPGGQARTGASSHRGADSPPRAG